MQEEEEPGSPSGAAQAAPAGEQLLSVTVSDPVTQGDHVSYRVSVSTDLPSYRWKQFSVIRRFRDFAFLHQRLCDQYPGVVVPALPEKRFATKLVAMGGEFVAERCAALDAFLKRVCAHGALRHAVALSTFLEASEADWAAWMQVPVEGLTLAKQRGDAASRLKGLGAAAGALFSPRAGDADLELERLRTYFCELEAHLADCAGAAETLVRRHGKLAGALRDFGAAMSALALGQPPQAALSLTQLGTCCVALGESSAGKAGSLTVALEAPLKDLVRSLAGVKGALASRAAAHATHQSLCGDLESRRTKIARQRESGKGDAARIAGEEREAAALSLRVEQAKAEYDAVCLRMEGELLRADGARAASLDAVARALGQAQREIAEEQASAFALMGVSGLDS